MITYKITIEYDGTGLAGWQKQPRQYSVQQALEEAVFKFSSEKAEVYSAGRTDAGVHALAMAAHFKIEKTADLRRMQEGLNFFLRKDEQLTFPMQIAVTSVEIAPDGFHARFSAKQRYYHYRIVNRRSHLALEQNRAWCVYGPCDEGKMHEAAQILVGRHDFTSFRDTACQSKNPIKTLDKIDVTREGEVINITCNAQSFLHHQVRNIVGSLKLVGTGKWQVSDMQKALDARDRRAAGPTAPAQGLYFVKVDY